jgi:hypothetical protein
MDELSYGLELPFESLDFDELNHSIVIPFAASLRQDRIGDFLDVTGIEMANHQKNPVAFLDHGKLGQPLPIGKTEDPQGNYTVWIDDGMAWARIFLAVGLPYPEGTPTPELVFELYKGGFLKAGSIGYRPLVAERIAPEPDVGYYKSALWLKKVELQEVTICGLPMNQDTVKSSLASGILNGKPLTSAVKSLLTDTLPKSLSFGVNTNMEIKSAMSATDQSQGGAFVAPAESKKKEKAADSPDAPVGEEEDAKSEDQPDIPVTLQACKEHLEAAADHADTPEELRASHSHFAKQIGDALSKSVMGQQEDNEKSMKSEDEEDNDEEEDEDDAQEQDDSDLIHDVKEHLEECADHEDCSPIMKAAHLYHAAALDKCLKCMGKSDDDEEEIEEEDGAKMLSILSRVGKRLNDSEKKLYQVFGR